MTVRFEGVSYTYPGTRMGLADIDLTVEDGELLTIIGASGSGKSTLLKLLAGFIVPDSGRILVNDIDISHLKPEARNLGIVFQNYALFPHMSAVQNVAYPLKMRGIGSIERLKLARDALARVGLGSLTERRPATLSGGQQQRVALARALVFSPNALLLDEPLSALDAALRVEMRDEIFKVQRAAGIATLHVTHDQEEALSLGDRVAVIADGRLVQIATPQVLYDHPANPAIAAFVGEANLWRGRVCAPGRVMLEEAGVVSNQTAGLELHANTQGFTVDDVVTVLIRPERIEPSISATGINTFGVMVLADRHLGAIRRIDLAIGSLNLKLQTHSREAFSNIKLPSDSIKLLRMH
ncbi:ABC transporter ATP-binding protein [Pseudochelatococcus sp. G4_1912]|uniref:ABC transporter ATP-binding protein n=1 Tax=Pseudochelatococcus sp. G4_1912 TaxID=3114288 RepID=UPI0039C6DB51